MAKIYWTRITIGMEDKLQQMINYIHQGKNIFEICDLLGVSKNTIRNWMKKAGLKSPPKFFSTGARIGRLPGFSQSDDFKKKMSEKFSGEGNPFFGKKHTNKTKKKMSLNHADVSGDKNPFRVACKDQEFLATHRLRCREIWDNRDDEYRRNFGEKQSKIQASLPQQNINKKHKSGFYTTKTGSCFYYRSSWEKIVLEELDNNPNVVNFYLEPFCIQYEDDGKKRHSRIDFYIEFDTGHIAIVEVKPTGLLDRAAKKIEGYRLYCCEKNFQFMILDSPYFCGEQSLSFAFESLRDGKHYL